LYEYFKTFNENDEHDDEAGTFLDNICDNQIYDDILNGDITEDEVLNAIKNLKNGPLNLTLPSFYQIYQIYIYC
jgi:hypothetical protein